MFTIDTALKQLDVTEKQVRKIRAELPKLNREKVDKQLDDLKKVIDESELEEGVEKIKELTKKKNYEKMSKENQDKLFIKSMKEVAPDYDFSGLNDTKNEISSLPFDTNINMDTSNMYDEDLIDEDSSQIFIVNRPYVVKG